MRLYRFIDVDKNIDTVVVTDGSCDQKRVFITEIRGIVSPGDVSATKEQVEGSNELLKLGFPWKVGHSVMHQELVDFAETEGLVLEITPQGLNELVGVEGEWNDNNCILTIRTSIPSKKEIEIHFPNTVTLDEAAGRYGNIRGDRKGLIAILKSRETSMTFSLEDLGLGAKEDLNVVITAESGIQKFELTAKK
jgi:hypothetical protein|uniref:Uncharacterized protein n=1 Tax=Siphoviridae sp. ct3r22 TaxID=2825325 RepID=A0A8S5V141_9CAUD|nr:MAG TPA: hypothetical protein [Siphoviridae sp. ct3r22]